MKKSIIFILLSIFFQNSLGHGEMTPIKKIRVGTPPAVILEAILKTNRDPNNPPVIKKNKKNYAPFITWLTDPSPEIKAQEILPTATENIFAIRNLAGQFLPALAAIEYGINELHTPVLLITAQSNSDIIATYLQHPDNFPLTIRQELNQLFRSTKATDQTKKTKPNLQLLIKTENHIDYQVSLALAQFSKKIKSGRLMVIGAILDSTAQYKNSTPHALQIININGVTDLTKIRTLPVSRQIGQDLAARIGREKK